MPNTGPGQHTKDISDGYHTFGELYEWRHALFLLVLTFNAQEGPNDLNYLGYPAWWTRNHHPDNDPMFEVEGQPAILVGLELPGMSVQFHMPSRLVGVVERYAKKIDHGPYYDGSNNPYAALTYLKDFLGV